MAPPLGNKFWEARSSHGRKPIFSSPDQLWKACTEYFNWMHENPLQEAKAFAFQGEVTVEPMPKLRAMTISGMCLFLDIDVTTWADYRRNDDFSHVCSTAEQIIYNQKFQGAAADMLNASIIARDLGLAEKKEHSGPNGGAIEIEKYTDIDLARRVAFLLSKASRDA